MAGVSLSGACGRPRGATYLSTRYVNIDVTLASPPWTQHNTCMWCAHTRCTQRNTTHACGVHTPATHSTTQHMHVVCTHPLHTAHHTTCTWCAHTRYTQHSTPHACGAHTPATHSTTQHMHVVCTHPLHTAQHNTCMWCAHTRCKALNPNQPALQ